MGCSLMLSERDKLFKLVLEKAFKYSDEPVFKLSSGMMSNYYINCKMVTLNPYGLNLIGEIVNDMINDNFGSDNISAVGGLTLGADPISVAASIMSYQRGTPFKAFVIRKEPKKYGLKKSIEGDVTAEDNVVIIEDVITKGTSTIKAIKCAKEADLKVKGVIALVDREEGGIENIKKDYDIKVLSIYKKSELLLYQKTHSQ
jgi:orotate phosphoribosyltransferase